MEVETFLKNEFNKHVDSATDYAEKGYWSGSAVSWILVWMVVGDQLSMKVDCEAEIKTAFGGA